MSNFNIKLNLQALKGAFVTNIKGRSATKACVCIPIEDAGVVLGQKGAYLDFSALELKEPKFDDTHCIKQQFDKDTYKALSEEERKAIPIVGGMKPMKIQPQAVNGTMEADPLGGGNVDDLPF